METAIKTINDGLHKTHTRCETTSAQIKQQCNTTHAHTPVYTKAICARWGHKTNGIYEE